MPEKYQPTTEDFQKAEESMTEEQKKMSEIREEGYQLGIRDAKKIEPEKTKGKPAREFDPKMLKESIEIIDLGPILTSNFRKMCRDKNINTMEELLENSEVDLLRGSGFGRKSLDALVEWLADHGAKLKKSEREILLENVVILTAQELKETLELDFNPHDLLIKTSDLEPQILQLNPKTGKRIVQVLNEAGKQTIFDIVTSKRSELHNIPNFSRQSFKLIEDLLYNRYNLTLPMRSFYDYDKEIKKWYDANLGK